MEGRTILYYKDTIDGRQLGDDRRQLFILRSSSPNLDQVNLAQCQTVYEDGLYRVDININEPPRRIKIIEAYCNGNYLGYFDFVTDESNVVQGHLSFQYSQGRSVPAYGKMTLHKQRDKYSGHPFLLQCDLVVLSFAITFEDDSVFEYFSPFMLCDSRNEEDSENILAMLNKLTQADNSQIISWLFAQEHKTPSSAVDEESGVNAKQVNSIEEFLSLVQTVRKSYQENFSYFKQHAKHTIKPAMALQPALQVKSVDLNSFNWLMQNCEQMQQVKSSKGINFRGHNYVPVQISAQISTKSTQVYENLVVMHFLCTVYHNVQQVYQEFNEDVKSLNRTLNSMQNNVDAPPPTTILRIKTIQLSLSKKLLADIKQGLDELSPMLYHYQQLLDVKPALLQTMPRSTKTFQEIKPYSQVFALLLKWFSFGPMHFEQDRLMMRIKTMDQIFEYFCLIELLQLLSDHGYTLSTSVCTDSVTFTETSASTVSAHTLDSTKTSASTVSDHTLNSTETTASTVSVTANAGANSTDQSNLTTTTLSEGRTNAVNTSLSIKEGQETAVPKSLFKQQLDQHLAQGAIQSPAAPHADKLTAAQAPIITFKYQTDNDMYRGNYEVANTYRLSKGPVSVTLYYQPLISSTEFQNDLHLFRTTSPHCNSDYYVPDFVLKFSYNAAAAKSHGLNTSGNKAYMAQNYELTNNNSYSTFINAVNTDSTASNATNSSFQTKSLAQLRNTTLPDEKPEQDVEEYIILDAKFSNRNNILNYYLGDVIAKYSNEVAAVVKNQRFAQSPKMVWVLQGRIQSKESPLWRFQSSMLSHQYLPPTSYGILAVNALTSHKQEFWSEMKRYIPWI